MIKKFIFFKLIMFVIMYTTIYVNAIELTQTHTSSDTLSNSYGTFNIYSNGYVSVNYNWKAIDNSNTSFWKSASNNTGYLLYQMPFSAKVTSYSIQCNSQDSTYSPKSFKLYGSNDASGFYELDSQVNQSFTQSETKTYTINNTDYFTYYRLSILTTQTVDLQPKIGEWSLFGDIYATPTPTPTPTPTNTPTPTPTNTPTPTPTPTSIPTTTPTPIPTPSPTPTPTPTPTPLPVGYPLLDSSGASGLPLDYQSKYQYFGVYFSICSLCVLILIYFQREVKI